MSPWRTLVRTRTMKLREKRTEETMGSNRAPLVVRHELRQRIKSKNSLPSNWDSHLRFHRHSASASAIMINSSLHLEMHYLLSPPEPESHTHVQLRLGLLLILLQKRLSVPGPELRSSSLELAVTRNVYYFLY
jgi:hypothetical protein